jgi:hypothetical protein
MSNSFQFHITTFSTPSLKVIFDFKLFCQEPKQPKVTRQSQIECRPAAPGRGKGRGRGPGRGTGRGGGNKSKQGKDAWDDGTWDDWMEDDWDPNWKWSAGQGWYWDDKVATKKKEPNEPKPKRARKAERKTHDSGEAGSSKPDKTPAAKASRKRQNSDSEEKKPAKSKRSTTEAEKEEDVEPKTKKEDVEPKTGKKRIGEEAGETQKCEGQQKNAVAAEPVPDPAFTLKEQKKEILDFLSMAKNLTDENAKENLRSEVHNFQAPGCGLVFNVYWVQKGIKGIGCGVKSKKENKDVAFFGYKSMCDSWIYAIAAAIKSAQLYVTFMRYDIMGVCITSMCVFERRFQWYRSRSQ